MNLLEQSEEERQAELRERARRLLSEARKGSVTTEIIRVTPEPIKQFDETDEKLQKLSEQITQLELQTNTVGEIQKNGGEEKSSPNNREKITPDKLPEDLGLSEVCYFCLEGFV